MCQLVRRLRAVLVFWREDRLETARREYASTVLTDPVTSAHTRRVPLLHLVKDTTMSNPFTTAIATEPAAADGQIGFIRNLLDHRDIFSLFDSAPKTADRVEVIRAAIVATPTPTVTGEWGDEVNRHLAKPLTKAGASKLIDLLQTMPLHHRPTAPRGEASFPPVEDGFYVVEDVHPHKTATVYKVQTSPNSGRQSGRGPRIRSESWRPERQTNEQHARKSQTQER